MGTWYTIRCPCHTQPPISMDLGAPTVLCPHEDGLVMHGSFTDLACVGLALKRAFHDEADRFETFIKIADVNRYVNERMVLFLDDVQLWQLELEQVQAYLTNKEYVTNCPVNEAACT